jgi:glutamate--cysteine ligase catalytic subunit
MGLLTVGKPLSFPDSQKFIQYVRDHGILQFLNIWHRVKDIENDELKWGDEIECGVFIVDHENKTIKISLRSAEVRLLTLLNWIS